MAPPEKITASLTYYLELTHTMASIRPQKVVVIGAGPVGALAALYAAGRGDIVEIYELRAGM